MRGRQSKAIPEIPGVPDLIAENAIDYVAIALRLDSVFRFKSGIKQRIRVNSGKRFELAEPLRVLAAHREQVGGSF